MLPGCKMTHTNIYKYEIRVIHHIYKYKDCEMVRAARIHWWSRPRAWFISFLTPIVPRVLVLFRYWMSFLKDYACMPCLPWSTLRLRHHLVRLLQSHPEYLYQPLHEWLSLLSPNISTYLEFWIHLKGISAKRLHEDASSFGISLWSSSRMGWCQAIIILCNNEALRPRSSES